MKEEEVTYSDNPLILLFDRPSKKGNLGTLLRSADALFVDEFVFTGHGVDIYDGAVITSSMGSFFKVPFRFIERKEDFEYYYDDLKERYPNIKIVGSSLQADKRIQDADFKVPLILLAGNEEKGLSNYYNEKADELVKINMRPNIDSLNVANAITTILYEIDRQRGE
jgi:TrmH family RNA methyltransferase